MSNVCLAVGTLRFIHRERAIVDERAVELHAQVLFGQPSGNLGVFIAPEELSRRRDDSSHDLDVLMLVFDEDLDEEVRKELKVMRTRCILVMK